MVHVKRIALFATLTSGIACGLFQPNPPANSVVLTSPAQPQADQTTAGPTAPTDQPGSGGILVAFSGGSFSIPAGLAGGATVEQLPAVQPDESAPWWSVAPAHVEVKLQSYALQGKFHEPQIVIYPTPEYAAMNESVAADLEELRRAIADPASISGPETLPGVPFFNAGALIAAQRSVVNFSGGQGIRTITEYAQFYAPINNGELFYHFQGLTDDGKSYIVAILPVTAPLLAPGGADSSVAPPGGIPFPGFDSIDPAEMAAYYASVTDLLDATASEQYQPALETLDALIQSLVISP